MTDTRPKKAPYEAQVFNIFYFEPLAWLWVVFQTVLHPAPSIFIQTVFS